MKLAVVTSLLFCVNMLYSQGWQQVKYNAADYRNEALNPELLAHRLTDNYQTEMEKVQSIFKWITGNISYRLKPAYWSPAAIKAMYDDDTFAVLKPINVRVAENVLRSNMAVCDGYARLFTTLCNFSNIRSEVITGYAQFNNNAGKSKFKSNHSWNAVRIDSSWYLLDATWASGYVNQGEFVRLYNDYYFLTPPRQFVQDHYPEDLQWTLLSDPPTLKEFNKSPFKSQKFTQVGVASYKPEKGIIEAAAGDTIRIELEIERLRINTDGSPDITFDPVAESQSPAWAFVMPDALVTTKTIKYTYIVSPNVSWLNLMLYDDVVMRYKVNVRGKDLTGTGQ